MVHKLVIGGVIISTYKIENVVASTSLCNSLDLHALAMSLEGSVYEPEQFPGLVHHIKEPKAALLLFRSGKVVCTGAKTPDQVHEVIGKAIKQIERTGITLNKDPEIIIQNIVASADLGKELNLNALAISLGLERVEYEPEQFPGLVYRMSDPKLVILIFGSGKLVCTGGKTPKEIEIGVDKLSKELRSTGLFR